MLYRMATTFALLICASFAAVAQETTNIGQYNTGAAQPSCPAAGCTSNSNNSAGGSSLPSVSVNGKWEVQDFKASDSSVSCAVIKFDSALAMPILHLLCPGPEVFAPLRVHLMLTWKNAFEIPNDVRRMLVDTSRSVKFKSKPGDSQAELTFHDPQATNSKKEWITFTEVNVGLVLPPKQHQ